MGPLEGIRIIEMAGIGPAPFCGMMLADQGAEVIVVHRPGSPLDPRDPLSRSRQTIAIDLKDSAGIVQAKELIRTAQGLVEGFRPGVMERLGLGPDVLLGDNPALAYGRMTGWGQHGPLASAAGHDINYIAITGALHACGRAGEPPTPPVNMLGDFGGGGMLMAFGMVTAILAAQRSGKGQVVDCAMVDGASLLMSMTWGFKANAGWKDERGVNLLDTGAHFYDCYETSDGKFVSLGSIEPQFYRLLLKLAELDDPVFEDQMNSDNWPVLKERMAALFRTRTRDDWCALMEGTDVCFAPVLSMGEAPGHPHNQARDTFVMLSDVMQPAPAPRFSAMPSTAPYHPVVRMVDSG